MSFTGSELIQIINDIGTEKKISKEAIKASLEDAIIKAYSKEYMEETFIVNVSLDSGAIDIFKTLLVVENNKEELNEYCEIEIDEAKKQYKDVNVDDVVKIAMDFTKLEKRVVLHILQVFKHNITVETNKNISSEWAPKVGQVMNFEVEKYEPKINAYIIDLKTSTYGFMAKTDSIPGENLEAGKTYKFLIKEVKEQSKGWPVILSRADANFVKFLLSSSIPEIIDNIIEIKAIARVAGFKTKAIVSSKVRSIDPVGTCIGQKGMRIKSITSEINNERIEFIQYDENPLKLIYNSCLPANIYGVRIDEPQTLEERRQITIIIDEAQLALIIGLKGKNVRLLSMLLNASIDIKTVQEAAMERLDYQLNSMNLDIY